MQYGVPQLSQKTTRSAFLRDELADMVEAGHWLVLPYSAVRHATDLRISPLGVVPQRDRRPRPIVDYTFSGVNEATVKLAPPESMQFGKALERIIQKAADANPRHGTVNLSKYDLADAFMRVGLSPSMILRLAVAVPTTSSDEDPLIAVPMVLPMGWMESPPTFCTVTETIADLANTKIAQGYIPASYHRHEAVANTTPQTPTMTEWNGMSAGLSRPTHGYWRCPRHICLIYTYDDHYKSPVLPKAKHWNGRCRYDTRSYTTTVG